MQHINRALLCLLTSTFIPAAFAASGSFEITVTSAAQPLNCSATNRYVSSAQVRVIPGGTGKIYVGEASMNVSTLAGVAAILFPNRGAMSEELDLDAPDKTDSIDLCNLNVIGAVPGELAIVTFTDTNSTYSTTPDSLVLAGTGATLNPNLDAYDPSNQEGSTILRLQVIPGQSGKLALKDITTGNVGTTLYPNSGNLAQHNAWSENVTYVDPTGTNDFAEGNFLVIPQVSGEEILQGVWRKISGSTGKPILQQFNGGAVATEGNATVSQTVVQFTTTYQQARAIRFQVTPGACSKVYIGNSSLDRNGNGTYKILYPNCSGGWSESVTVGDPTDPNSVIDPRQIYIAADQPSTPFIYEMINGFAEQGGGTFATLSTLKSVIGSTPQAIGLGMVSRLRISVTPGQTGKIFVGNASMNTATLAGVYEILSPNPVGRMSEEFNLNDPDGDGIDTSEIYVAGDVPGEYALVSTLTKGVTPAQKFVEAFSGQTSMSQITSISTPIAALIVARIPGIDIDHKDYIGDYATGSLTYKILWPNAGYPNIGEGWSETFVSNCTAGNCEDLSNDWILGGHLVVGAWKRQ